MNKDFYPLKRFNILQPPHSADVVSVIKSSWRSVKRDTERQWRFKRCQKHKTRPRNGESRFAGRQVRRLLSRKQHKRAGKIYTQISEFFPFFWHGTSFICRSRMPRLPHREVFLWRVGDRFGSDRVGAVKEDYLAVTPPLSFIHVEDFNDTKQLVNYIKYLEKNHKAYRE